MQKGKPDSIASVMNWIFDPRNNDRMVSAKLKKGYQLNRLSESWAEIVGENLGRSSRPARLERGELTVTTASSSLASELFMMQELLIGKINKFLDGSVVVKKVRFATGGSAESVSGSNPGESTEPKTAFKITRCPSCGARIKSDISLCYACERERRDRVKSSLRELLNVQPWLSYEQAQEYIKCDSILFGEVKDGLRNYYYEKVRLGTADEVDKSMAVMLLTGKGPEEISLTQRANALVRLRGDSNVPSYRGGLHGKKQ